MTTKEQLRKALLMPEGDDFLPGGRFWEDSDYGEDTDREEEEEDYWDREIAKERAKERRSGF